MHPPQRLALYKPRQRLVAEGELPQGETALAAEAARAQADEVFQRIVFRAVDDAQILPSAHLQGGLNEPLGAAGDEGSRLDHRAFAAACGDLLPPGDRLGASVRVVERERVPTRDRERLAGLGDPRRNLHVPAVWLVEMDRVLACKQVAGRD